MKPEIARPGRPASWAQQVAELASESDRAYLIALRAVGSPSVAEEAVQEAYLRMLKYPQRDLERGQVLVYMFKTVRSVAINLSKAAQHRRDREKGHAMRLLEAETSAPERVASAETARAVRAAVEKLPQEEREAVSLCFEQDMTQQAAADVLRVPERTLSDRVRRGLERLRVGLAAQGLAALTPLAVGEGLRGLGVPPAPAGLASVLGKIVAVAAHKSVRMLGAGTAGKAGAGYGTAVTVGAVLTAAAAGGFWWVSRDAGTSPVPPGPTAEQAAPAEAPVYARWSFADGPAPDLEVTEGRWEWKRPNAGKPGFMLAPPNQKSRVRLPTVLPARPFMITARCVSGRARNWSVGAMWSSDRVTLQRREWERFFPNTGGRIMMRVYFTGHHAIVSFDASGKTGMVSWIAEYRQDYPSDRVSLWLTNMEVTEIELKSIRPDEIPAPLKDPGRLSVDMSGPSEFGMAAP